MTDRQLKPISVMTLEQERFQQPFKCFQTFNSFYWIEVNYNLPRVRGSNIWNTYNMQSRISRVIVLICIQIVPS